MEQLKRVWNNNKTNIHVLERSIKMNKKRNLIVLVLLMVTFLIAGCTDSGKIEKIDQTLKDIHASLEKIEEKIGKLPTSTASRRPTIDYNKVHNIPIGKAAIKGDKNAPITVVEFSDFQCPYCARLQPTLVQVLNAYPKEVKLVYKHYPLAFHKQAKNAAKASEAAGEQGKFWEMHDLIFEKFNKLTDASFKEFAEQLGLDVNKFLADFNSNKYDQQIEGDINLARTVGVTGTPTLYMNGKRMQRRSFDDFKEAIENNLKQLKAS
jgi:protein-disulfide isomerase